MTPEDLKELDAIEAAYREHAPECPFPGEKVMDALREAWAERDDLFTRASIASGDARYLRAALDRVRALCLPGRASVWIADIRAAIDGTEE